MDEQKEITVICVDDEEDNLMILAALVKKLYPEARVLTAESGKEGLRLVRKELPDLVLLDVRMPGMDGYQVCQLLKADNDTAHIPVLMITGFRKDPQCKIDALTCGADGFLLKPFDQSEFQATVKAMLRIKQTEDLLRQEKQALRDQLGVRARQLKEKQTALQQYEDIVRNMQLGLFVYHLEDRSDDTTLRMVRLNKAASDIIGVPEKALLGNTLDGNFPGLRDQGIPQKYAEVIRTGVPARFEDIAYGDQRVKPSHFLVQAIPLPDDHVAVLFDDISKQKEASDAAEKSLKENQLLMRDIHHRIKNNLSMMSSMLNMQSRYIGDEKARAAFKQSRKRIQAIALLHEKLYQSQNMAHVEFKHYGGELMNALLESSPFPKELVNLETDIGDTCFDVDTAIPLGLIVTELVTNALKYGGKNDHLLNVLVRLAADPGKKKLTLTVSDDGPGIPASLDWQNTESLGLQLVNMLTEQLEGEIRLLPGNGTCFEITFPDKGEKPCENF